MINLPAGTKIWLVAGITDMRNGFNGLAAKVQTALKDDRCPATSSSSGEQRQSGKTALVHRRWSVPADKATGTVASPGRQPAMAKCS
jgi:transposase